MTTYCHNFPAITRLVTQTMTGVVVHRSLVTQLVVWTVVSGPVLLLGFWTGGGGVTGGF